MYSTIQALPDLYHRSRK